MRQEVENLHMQQQHYHNMSNSGPLEDAEILETRLRQTTAEMSKLQKEKRRLMEISNELQSQLRRVRFLFFCRMVVYDSAIAIVLHMCLYFVICSNLCK